ncbi:MAG: tetratricopeptide repeat protein [Planctomycetota bacterium]
MRAHRIATVTFAALVALASSAAPARADAVADGKRFVKERRWIPAAEAFADALKASPANRDAAVGLARAAAEGRLADRYDLATSSLGAVLRASPDDREARLAYGYLFLARASVDHRYRADAQEQFQKLLRAKADDADAAIGLARYFFFGGEYERANATLDDVLKREPANANAHFWKGTLAYDQAKEALQGGMTPAVIAGFKAAAASFGEATKADPSRADAWINLAYANQYLLGAEPTREGAVENAYLKALDADPSDDAPMRGLSSLYSNRSEKYAEIVARLAKERPKSPAVLFAFAVQAKAAGKFDDALAALKTYVEGARNPARGWFEMAEILREKKEDLPAARKAYEATLKADPAFSRAEVAVGWLLQPIQEKSRDMVRTPEDARALLKEFDALIALAPKSINARNDAGFFLREAYDATGRKHKDLLDACVARYVAAADLVGEFMPGYERIPYGDRHGFAQVLNDTGLMFQYYPPVQDLRKAEKYYRMAMDWTEFGYWDVYGNMMKLLDAEKRLEDAAVFAENCAEGIKQQDGTPQETFRKIAQADAERLRKLIENQK